MSHMHYGGPESTQNQGNYLGERPSVKQSAVGRDQNSGSAMRGIMGGYDGPAQPAQAGRRQSGGQAGGVPWATDAQPHAISTQQQASGSSELWTQRPARGGPQQNTTTPWATETKTAGAPIRTTQQQASSTPWATDNTANGGAKRVGRPGAGAANRGTYNIFTGE